MNTSSLDNSGDGVHWDRDASLDPDADLRNKYFPQVVVNSFVSAISPIVSGLLEAHARKPEEMGLLKMERPIVKDVKLPLERSQKLILEALEKFDPQLKNKAKDIFDVKGRVQIRNISPEDKVENQHCNPRDGSTKDAKKNPEGKATVHLDDDGTIATVIYLAHEIGHAIADDYQVEKGDRKSYDNPEHMQETQAYFIQHVIYDYLGKHEEAGIKQAANRHFTAEMSGNLYDVPVSLAAKDALDAFFGGAEFDPEALFKKHFGSNFEKFKEEYTLAGKPVFKSPKAVFDQISALKVFKKGDEEAKEEFKELREVADRLHGGRPPCILTALGIFSHLDGQDLATKRLVSETLLGRHGSSKIEDVLEVAGIQTVQDIQNLANAAVRKSTAPSPASSTVRNGDEYGRTTEPEKSDTPAERLPLQRHTSRSATSIK